MKNKMRKKQNKLKHRIILRKIKHEKQDEKKTK